MECYRLIIEVNGLMKTQVFIAKDEEHKKELIKEWWYKNVTPYDKWKIFFNGSIEQQDNLIYKHPNKFK
jgi:hypothetical protein